MSNIISLVAFLNRNWKFEMDNTCVNSSALWISYASHKISVVLVNYKNPFSKALWVIYDLSTVITISVWNEN